MDEFKRMNEKDKDTKVLQSSKEESKKEETEKNLEYDYYFFMIS